MFQNDQKEKVRGLLIVVEGLDRCGKTTQVTKLVESLRRLKISIEPFHFPDRKTETGEIINAFLKSKARPDGPVGDDIPVDDTPDVQHTRAIALLFAANRWEKAAKIEKLLMSGTHVVIDRYSFSGLAYPRASYNDQLWMTNLEVGLPAPDVAIMLDATANELRGRYPWFTHCHIERYDTVREQQRVRHEFKRIMKVEGGTWHVINAMQSKEQVQADIKKLVLTAIESDAVQSDLDTMEPGHWLPNTGPAVSTAWFKRVYNPKTRVRLFDLAATPDNPKLSAVLKGNYKVPVDDYGPAIKAKRSEWHNS
jgi:dTMP kinase